MVGGVGEGIGLTAYLPVQLLLYCAIEVHAIDPGDRLAVVTRELILRELVDTEGSGNTLLPELLGGRVLLPSIIT